MHSVVALTIIVVMSVVMTGTATKKIVTINTVVTVQGLRVVASWRIVVVPGLHPRRGNMMIEGLQGTMITGEEAMMIADHLIIMMIVAGMTMTENAMTEDAMKKITTTGLQDPRMETVYGVEEFITGVWIRGNIFLIGFAFRILDFSDPCGVTVVYRGPVYFSNGWSTLSGGRVLAQPAYSGSRMDSPHLWFKG